MSVFDAAFEKLIGHEGDYVNNPADPGGETKFGVSKRSYPDVNIAALTLGAAKAIYKRDYWDRVSCDALPPIVAFVVFDSAVNNGVKQAARFLQAASGVAQDGVVGPATIKAAWVRPAEAMAAEINAQRLWFMSKLNTWPTFGLGWARRLASLPFEAVKLA